MAAANADVDPDQRIVLRIGINLGDVIIDGDDLYGDGVNIAARLQAMAEPGGIWLSRQVHDQVETKLDVAFDDLGVKELKNIARPVQVFRIAGTGQEAGSPAPADTKRPSVAILPFANMSGDPEQRIFQRRHHRRHHHRAVALPPVRWLHAIPRSAIATAMSTSGGWAANSARATWSKAAFAVSASGSASRPS